MAVAALVGARVGGGPGVLAGAGLAAGVLGRRSVLVVLATAVVAGGLADRALAGLHPPAPAPVDAWTQLIGDPEPLDGGGTRVVVSLDGRRVEATAFGAASGDLEARAAGERVHVRGHLRPVDDPPPWLVSQRIVGRLGIDQVVAWQPGRGVTRLANGLRRTIEAGAEHLPAEARSLLLGVVLGDDRHQPPEVADDFRAAGLSHLLAVSGQNVAFVLVLVGPVLTRLRWRARLPATLAVVGFFCLVVRFEPSVVRAAGMTAVATVASALGRPAAGIRVLGLAVTGLVLVDPLLARSVGFGLSASASAGILLLGPRIERRLRGPRVLREGLAVTLAAQAGALPLLLATFGQVPVATVPANLVAAPAAGPLMVWGLGAGLVAGAGPGWLAAALHLPTSVLAWWLTGVASWGAGLPLGSIDAGLATGVGAAAGFAWLVGRRAPTRRGVLLVAVLVSGVLVAVGGRPSPSTGTVAAAPGLDLVVLGPDRVLVVESIGTARHALDGLRRAGVRCVDVVAVTGRGRAVAVLVAALARRCPGLEVVAPAGRAHPGWGALAAGEAFVVGGLVVEATADGALAVRSATPRGPP